MADNQENHSLADKRGANNVANNRGTNRGITFFFIFLEKKPENDKVSQKLHRMLAKFAKVGVADDRGKKGGSMELMTRIQKNDKVLLVFNHSEKLKIEIFQPDSHLPLTFLGPL